MLRAGSTLIGAVIEARIVAHRPCSTALGVTLGAVEQGRMERAVARTDLVIKGGAHSNSFDG